MMVKLLPGALVGIAAMVAVGIAGNEARGGGAASGYQPVAQTEARTDAAAGGEPGPAGETPVGPANEHRDPIVTYEEALLRDAEFYARDQGISIDEAVQRLLWQEEAHETQLALLEVAPERFAAMWFEHDPEWKLVIWYTGDATGLEDAFQLVQGASFPAEVRTGAAHTMEELQAARAAAVEKLGVDNVGASYVVHQEGRVVIELPTASDLAADRERLERELRDEFSVPFELLAVDVEQRTADTFGGKRLSYTLDFNGHKCTSGFTVANWAGATGVTTAAHCPNTLYYWQSSTTWFGTTFVAETWDPYRDLQWSSVAGPEFAKFFDGYGLRSVKNGKEPRITQLGSYACHWGETTGLSCGYVEQHDFVPAHGAGTGFCGPTYAPCGASWMRLAGSQVKCWTGDSGGPVWYIQSAYGTVAGCRHFNFYTVDEVIYTAVDYLWDLGVYLLTE